MNKIRLVTALCLFFLFSCYGPFQRINPRRDRLQLPQLAFKNKRVQKRLITPPSIITGAVFDFKKQHHQWPYPLVAACVDPECREQYQKLLDQGIASAEITYMSRDSMIVDVLYDLDKHARYMESSETYYPNIIKGKYVFVSDSSLKIFSILVGKDLKKKS